MISINVQVNPDLDCQDRFWWRIGGGERLWLPREKASVIYSEREREHRGLVGKLPAVNGLRLWPIGLKLHHS